MPLYVVIFPKDAIVFIQIDHCDVYRTKPCALTYLSCRVTFVAKGRKAG